jgi:hypothetical protein
MIVKESQEPSSRIAKAANSNGESRKNMTKLVSDIQLGHLAFVYGVEKVDAEQSPSGPTGN